MGYSKLIGRKHTLDPRAIPRIPQAREQRIVQRREMLELSLVSLCRPNTSTLLTCLSAWIDSVEDEDALLTTNPTDRLLSAPSKAHSAQPHYAPTQAPRR